MAEFIRVPFAVEGDQQAIPQELQTDGNVSMQTGFTYDYERDPTSDPNAKDVPRPETNWLYNLITTAIHQYQTEGTFPYITAAQNGGKPFPYKKLARCSYAGEGVSGIFESLVDNNTAYPTDTTKWKRVLSPGDITVKTTSPLTGGGALSADVSIGINATAAATKDTAILRDANARAKIATPSAETDIANKQYVDDAVNAINSNVLTDAAEATTLPATTTATLAALLQTVRNCLKWILARMDFRTASVTIYVRKDGNDSNSGFTNNATGAVASWTGVFNVLQTLRMRNANVTVAFQAGTFGGTYLTGDQFVGSGASGLYVTGVDGATIFDDAISVDGSFVRFTDCTFKGPVNCRYNGWLGLYNCSFIEAATVTSAISAIEGGVVYIHTALSFSGAFTYGIRAYMFGEIRTVADLPITFKNKCSFSYQYLLAGAVDGPGVVNLRGSISYTGTFTGQRYYIGYGGKITGKTKTQLDALPGTLDGTLSSGSGVTQSPQFVSSGTSSASGYLLADGTDIFEHSSGATGYIKLGGGMILQWGVSGSMDLDGVTTLTFPMAFPTACRRVMASMQNSSTSNDDVASRVLSFTTTQVTLRAEKMDGTHSGTRYVQYFAIGN